MLTFIHFTFFCPNRHTRYKATYEYFLHNIEPELLLRVSIVISFSTLAFGIVAVLLNQEKLPTKLLATVYCLVSLIARFAVFTAMFVEFGYTALSLIIPAYFLRTVMVVAREWEGTFNSITSNAGLKTRTLILPIQMTLIFDHALTFILPFGKHHHPELDVTSNWHLALQGAQNHPLVEEKLTSPFALGNLALTLLENSVGWLCVCLVDSGSKTTANVTMWYFHMCGLLMMGLMLVTLALTYACSREFPAMVNVSDMQDHQLKAYFGKFELLNVSDYFNYWNSKAKSSEQRDTARAKVEEHSKGPLVALNTFVTV